jgi:hypothetical protein
MITLDRGGELAKKLSIERPRPERFSAESRGLAGRSWGEWTANSEQGKIPDNRGKAADSGNAQLDRFGLTPSDVIAL